MSQLFNNLLTQNDSTFLDLLKTYSVFPPDDPGFTSASDLTKPDPANAAGTLVRKVTTTAATDARFAGSSTGSVRLLGVNGGQGVLYVDLNPYPINTAPDNFMRVSGGNTIYLSCRPNVTANYVPVWFLPWEASGAAVRMTLPAAGGAGVNPDVFITAGIGGCSVFFQGTPSNPTIYHLGGGTGFASHQINEGAIFWEAVMDQFLQEDTALGINHGALHNQNVDKRDYVSQVGFTNVNKQGDLIKSTGRAYAYQQELQKQMKKGPVRVQEVSPFGSVLGRRDGAGNWKFYLQESATVTYYEITSKNPITRLRGKNKSKTAAVSVPLQIREIFPGGPGVATIKPTLPKIV